MTNLEIFILAISLNSTIGRTNEFIKFYKNFLISFYVDDGCKPDFVKGFDQLYKKFFNLHMRSAFDRLVFEICVVHYLTIVKNKLIKLNNNIPFSSNYYKSVMVSFESIERFLGINNMQSISDKISPIQMDFINQIQCSNKTK